MAPEFAILGMMLSGQSKPRIQGKLMRSWVVAHWRGQLSLFRSLILNGVVGGLVIVLSLPPLGAAIRFLALPSPGYLISAVVVLAAVSLYAVWAVVGILRCSLRVFRSPTSSRVEKLVGAGLLIGVLAVVLAGVTDDIKMLVSSM
jgi:hypothetical protein